MLVLSNYIKPIIVSSPLGACNGSLLHTDTDYLLARYTNYTTVYNSINKRIEYFHFADNDNIFSDNLLYKIDLNTGKTVFTQYVSQTSAADKKVAFSGLEDCRLMKWGNDTFVSGTVTDGNHVCVMHQYNLTKNYKLVNDVIHKTKNKIEKNWQPIECMPYKYVYSYKPFIITDFISKKFITLGNDFKENYSGSSAVIKMGEYNLSLVHTRVNRKYVFYLVLFNKDMHVLKVSQPFSFTGAWVEFSCFMEKIETGVRILMSINDQISLIFNLSDDDVTCIFEGTYTNGNTNYNLIDEIYYTAKNANNILGALGIATYSNNKDVIKDAIVLNHEHEIKLPFRYRTIMQKILMNNLS